MAETLEQLDVKYVESEKSSLNSSKKMKELTTALQVRKKKQKNWKKISKIFEFKTREYFAFQRTTSEEILKQYVENVQDNKQAKNPQIVQAQFKESPGPCVYVFEGYLNTPPPLPTGKCEYGKWFLDLYSIIWNVKKFLRCSKSNYTEDRSIRAGSRIICA
jgi:hypothetical protein